MGAGVCLCVRVCACVQVSVKVSAHAHVSQELTMSRNTVTTFSPSERPNTLRGKAGRDSTPVLELRLLRPQRLRGSTKSQLMGL